MIEKQTNSLFIYKYNDDSQRFFEKIRHESFLSRNDARQMQMYSVPVYDNFLIKYVILKRLSMRRFLDGRGDIYFFRRLINRHNWK